MASKLYDLAVKTGVYTDRQTNQEKGRWQNVGAVMQGDDGSQFIMLAKWFNPAGVPDLNGKGGESILVSCFAPQQQGQQQPQGQAQGGGQPQQRQQAAPRQQAPAQQPQRTQQFDDDIPF